MQYIDVQDVSFAYGNDRVLEKISYQINSGEFVTLTGENGAAKSTLLKLTLGILPPLEGKVVISKYAVEGHKLRIAYVPQEISSFTAGFPSSILEFVRSGRYPRRGWFKRLNKHDDKHVQKALESVGLWEMRNKKVGEISGGQKQRAVIARAFASDPDLFVLDEPTVGMDDKSLFDFYRLMSHAARRHGKSVLLVTHDPDSVKKYVDRSIHLAKGDDGFFTCFELHAENQAESEIETENDILADDKPELEAENSSNNVKVKEDAQLPCEEKDGEEIINNKKASEIKEEVTGA